MFRLSFFLLILLPLPLLSQLQVLYFVSGDTVLVFGDKINMRTNPSTESASVAQLVAADRVIIEEATEQITTINKIALPWYKVRLFSGQRGFVWGGLLSPLQHAEFGGTTLVAGVVSVSYNKGDDPPTWTIEFRAVKRGIVIHKVSFHVKQSGSLYTRCVDRNCRNLQGCQALVVLEMGSEGCGFPWSSMYVLWDGNIMVPLPVCTSIADGNAFYHSERYLFPQGEYEGDFGHGMEPTDIYYSVSHMENEPAEQGWNENSWERVRKMVWDGKKWNKPIKMDLPH